MRVGVIGESLCLLMPSMSSDIGGFGEFGELFSYAADKQTELNDIAMAWIRVPNE